MFALSSKFFLDTIASSAFFSIPSTSFRFIRVLVSDSSILVDISDTLVRLVLAAVSIFFALSRLSAAFAKFLEILNALVLVNINEPSGSLKLPSAILTACPSMTVSSGNLNFPSLVLIVPGGKSKPPP